MKNHHKFQFINYLSKYIEEKHKNSKKKNKQHINIGI